MLKIPKGLKKKKKSKKSKHKEEELFDSAELEQYRREQQQKQEAGSGETGEGHETENSEEWQKFKALTSGVDDILKKTQGDLDRIKSTSFFQKKPPGPSSSVTPAESTVAPSKREQEQVKGKWVGFEEGAESNEEKLEEPVPVPPEEAAAAFAEEEKQEEEEEEESEFEDDQDDIFDTTYVDVVTSGEVKLAYVPDSPEKEDDFDPFDTSIVDKVIKTDPQQEKKKKLVSLGCAVEVLTGKLEKSAGGATESNTQIRRRPKPQDLLLGSFDEGFGAKAEVAAEAEPAPKSILDEDPIFEEETSAILTFPPVTPLCENLPVVSTPKFEKPQEVENLKSLVDEFVPSFVQDTAETFVEPEKKLEDDLDDEFAALAAESLSKLHAENKKPARPPRPEAPKLPVEDEDEDVFNEEENDPFDTSFAAEILPGKFELKLIEKEILESNDFLETNKFEIDSKIKEAINNSDLNNKSGEFSDQFGEDTDFANLEPLTVKHRDLLGGSTTDLSKIVQNPIVPASVVEDTNDFSEIDPFDTSIVENLVVPGKTELKFLEKELLEEEKPAINVEIDDDDDFDPRADEKFTKPVVARPDNLTVGSKRFSVPKVVAFDVKSPSNLPDLLAVEQEENSKVGKPLTPYYPPSGSEQISQSDVVIDPFDTSFVSNCPGDVELKLIEKELVAEGTVIRQQSLSDEDFDPRQETSTTLNIPQKFNKDQDIISGDVEHEVKLHTPVVPKKVEENVDLNEDFDPFDTSIASGLVPGKAEIKILETELIYSKESPTVKVSTSAITEALIRKNSQSSSPGLSVSDVLEVPSDEIAVKPLTPVTASSIDLDDTSDPFDTSGIGDILPGRTELKLLESELMLN